MVELNVGLDAQPADVRPDLPECIAQGYPDRLEHLDVAPWLIQQFDTDAVDRRHEGRRAAVHDRGFRTVDLHPGIVNAETGERRQDMLCGGYQGPQLVAQHSGEISGGDRTQVSGDLLIGAPLEAGANKPQPAAGVSRM